jgi:hypothetical protein
MNTLILSKIEKQMTRLSFDEQLWLMERLAHSIRRKSPMKMDDWEHQLARMAADSEIQNELEVINTEFLVTENDGLD